MSPSSEQELPADTAPASAAAPTNITFSPGLSHVLHAAGCAIAFTTYQRGGLYLVGTSAPDQLTLHEAVYPQAMGVVGNTDRIYLGTLTQLVRLENVLSPGQIANNAQDKLYVPRNMQTLGAIDSMRWASGPMVGWCSSTPPGTASPSRA